MLLGRGLDSLQKVSKNIFTEVDNMKCCMFQKIFCISVPKPGKIHSCDFCTILSWRTNWKVQYGGRNHFCAMRCTQVHFFLEWFAHYLLVFCLLFSLVVHLHELLIKMIHIDHCHLSLCNISCVFPEKWCNQNSGFFSQLSIHVFSMNVKIQHMWWFKAFKFTSEHSRTAISTHEYVKELLRFIW